MKMCPRHKLRPAVAGCSRCEHCIAVLAKLRAKRRAAGLCRCGKIPETGYVLCPRCQQLLSAKQRNARAAGLCGCGKPKLEGRQCCGECLTRHKAGRARLKKKKICPCGKRPFREGGKSCQECVNLTKIKKAERRASGKCMCGKPLVGKLTKCEVCLDRVARRQAKRLQTDQAYAIKRRIRNCIWGAITRKVGQKKRLRTEVLLGCTIAEAKKHIEEKFEPWMSWNNQGQWHIDHYIPCGAFDLRDERQQRLCNNWRNLQPMWGKDSFSKSAKLPPDFEQRWMELEVTV